MEESYIQATRLEDEYQLKSFMVCGDAEDTKNSFIEDKDTDSTTEVTTTTTTTPVRLQQQHRRPLILLRKRLLHQEDKELSDKF